MADAEQTPLRLSALLESAAKPTPPTASPHAASADSGTSSFAFDPPATAASGLSSGGATASVDFSPMASDAGLSPGTPAFGATPFFTPATHSILPSSAASGRPAFSAAQGGPSLERALFSEDAPAPDPGGGSGMDDEVGP